MRKLASALLLAAAAFLPAGASAQTPVTLNWALWDWDKVVFYKPLIEAYEKAHPGVTINHTDLGSADYNQMLMTQLTGGATNLDIVTVKDSPGYAQLVNANALADLNTLLEKPVDPAPYNGLIESMTVNGKLAAVPFRSDIWVLYYNRGLFEKAGVAPPTNDMTLDQFADLARKMTSGFGSKKVYGGHLHTWRSTVQLPAILDGKHTLVSRDYSFLAPYYERVLKLQKDGAIQSYGSLKSTSTHYSGPFFNEQVAMMPMGTWFIATQIAKVKSGESLSSNWGIVSLPHPDGVAPGTTAAQVTSLGVNANSPNAKAAADFVSFVSGPEGAKIIASTGTLPAIRDEAVVKTVTSKEGFPTDAASREALNAPKTYLELPIDPKAAQVELVLNRAHDAIMTDNVSVEQGLADLNRDVGAVLDR